MTALLSSRAVPNDNRSIGHASRRFAHAVSSADVAADFASLSDKAIAAISEGEPVVDDILGGYVHLASLVRAVSFREGKLLEQGMIRIAQAHPDLTVLWKSIKLPIVPAAVEALAGNDWGDLEGIKLDADARTRQSYTPDLIIVNRVRHAATILDLKRSLASYGDTNRLSELRCRMLAAAMILPDWLYKTQKKLMVDSVGIAIIDGASRPSDHDQGFWGLSDIDELLEIDGAAACMAELRKQFGARVQTLLETEARKALGLAMPTAAISLVDLARGVKLSAEGDSAPDLTPDGTAMTDHLPVRVRIGFAQRYAAR